jgi:hypothetical protein
LGFSPEEDQNGLSVTFLQPRQACRPEAHQAEAVVLVLGAAATAHIIAALPLGIGGPSSAGSAGLGFCQTGNLRPAFPVLLTSCRSRLPTRASQELAASVIKFVEHCVNRLTIGRILIDALHNLPC